MRCAPILLALAGCGAIAYSPEAVHGESARLNRFLEESFLTRVDRSPQFQARLGIQRDQGAWDDISDAHAREDREITARELERLRADFDFEKLNGDAQLSYRLFEYEAERTLERFTWRFHDYPVNQMHGVHANVPAFLESFHRIDDVADAEAYVERLNGIPRLFDQLIENLELREELGILPPAFVFPRVIEDCRNILAGRPFEPSGADGTILADFRSKLARLERLDEATRERLLGAATAALTLSVGPAYEELIGVLERQSAEATTDAGAWKLPDGDTFYRFALEQATTTRLTPAAVHTLGLSEVARIHDEMRAIVIGLRFEGDLQDFFRFLREDERFYYPNDDSGRAAYLRDVKAILESMEARLDELFLTRPKAAMVVKAVEPYRAASAGKAFYQRGTPDGSRPGTYYANLYDMTAMPRYQMEALAFHEGIPGHHMQSSIAQELEGLPSFRKHGHYTAYGEGWGLYAEVVPKEMGFYGDDYSDFGRLAMELWRACRLVVDTGIHHRRWTREQAIDYLRRNTPNSEGDCIKAVERYIVMPAQATAYTIGMLKILELRQRAQDRLGERFDVRVFHDVLLRSGPVPLDVLDELVEAWIAPADS